MKKHTRFQYAERRTPEYDDAVKAIEKLVGSNGEGVDDARRAFAEGISDGIISLNKSLGLKKSSSSNSCVCRLLGKHHHYDEDPSLCYLPHSDHPYYLNRNGVPVALVSEPYNLGQDQIKNIISFCDTNGIDFHIDNEGSWFPGRTLRMVFKKSPMVTEQLREKIRKGLSK
jgi:hypothetical protein